jgi:hypothetical protein
MESMRGSHVRMARIITRNRVELQRQIRDFPRFFWVLTIFLVNSPQFSAFSGPGAALPSRAGAD